MSRDQDVVIVAGLRTPFAKSGGELASVPADDLARQAMRALIDRLDLDVASIDEVILGCVAQPLDAMNVGRVAALRAGVPNDVPAITVHRNCASSMEAITIAAERMRAGRGEVFLVGGTENMSQIPLTFSERAAAFFNRLARAKAVPAKLAALAGFRPGMIKPHVALIDGLSDKTCGMIMGATAEKLSREFHITRADQDAFALQSHERAVDAEEAGRLADERTPAYVPPKFKTPVDTDRGPRKGQSLEALGKLKPYFERRYGTVTVGNSCPITDGAVALLMTTRARADAEGWPMLGVLEDYAYAGLDPSRMGLGPVFATKKLFDRVPALTIDKLDRIEINEAFAAQVLACRVAFESRAFAKAELDRDKPLGAIDPDKLNVNGGAIALGHPVGATGGRLVLTILHELARSGGQHGLASLCVGGGQGAALLLRLPDADPLAA